MYQLMKDAGQRFNPKGFVSAVSGYYTTTDGKMLSMPYNSSTPVLWVNKDLMKKAGLDPEMDLSTWKRVGNALDAAKAKGIDMPFCTCWHSCANKYRKAYQYLLLLQHQARFLLFSKYLNPFLDLNLLFSLSLY